MRDNAKPLWVRLWKYQGERFPIQQYLLVVGAFAFSASGYSLICGGRRELIGAAALAVGFLTSYCLFFLLRLFDEFKDAEEDAKYRPYRAVPRGLVSLVEVRWMIVAVTVLVVAMNALLDPRLLLPLAGAYAYILLMWREFFVPRWLRRHPVPYMLTHMVVMPLIDFYTSGLDWLAGGHPLPRGMFLFLALTFTNGCVIEIGRKIRVPDDEEPGVETYSALWGGRRAAGVWLAVLATTFALAVICTWRQGFAREAGPWLGGCFALSAAPAVAFLFGRRTGHLVELASGVWTIAMYVLVGAVPLLAEWGWR